MVAHIRVSASLLGADLANLADAVAEAQNGGCDELHFDVMDGHLVPNISMGLPVLQAVRRLSNLPIEAHMMVTNPLRFIDAYAPFCDIYSFHIESSDDPFAVLNSARQAGLQVGVAINPDTPLAELGDIVNLVDRVLVMSVNPGAAGQSFICAVLPKITALSAAKPNKDTKRVIAVDGGVKVDNAHLSVRAGATVLVSATGLFKHPDGVGRAVELFKNSGAR